MSDWDQQKIWDEEDRLQQQNPQNPWDPPVGTDLAGRLQTLPLEEDFVLGNDGWVIKRSFVHGPTSAAVKLVYKRHRKTELRVCKAALPEENSQQAPKEVRILMDVLPRHERLCAILDYFPAPENVFLMEFYDGGDLEGLAERYRQNDEFFPESFLWHLLFQGAEGLAYIHHGRDQIAVPKHKWRPVIHADIKPENIFLQWRPGCNPDTDYPDIKLGDFGISIIVEERTDKPPYVYTGGTEAWRPPEQPLVTFKADVWSLGAVIHYLCHGNEPAEVPASDRKLGAARKREVIPIRRFYSRALQYWFDQVLEQDPDKRIDSAILADSLAGIVPVLLKRKKPLDSWAARRFLDRGSTPPRPLWPWNSQDQEPLAQDSFHDDDEPDQDCTGQARQPSSPSQSSNSSLIRELNAEEPASYDDKPDWDHTDHVRQHPSPSESSNTSLIRELYVEKPANDDDYDGSPIEN